MDDPKRIQIGKVLPFYPPFMLLQHHLTVVGMDEGGQCLGAQLCLRIPKKFFGLGIGVLKEAILRDENRLVGVFDEAAIVYLVIQPVRLVFITDPQFSLQDFKLSFGFRERCGSIHYNPQRFIRIFIFGCPIAAVEGQRDKPRKRWWKCQSQYEAWPSTAGFDCISVVNLNVDPGLWASRRPQESDAISRSYVSGRGFWTVMSGPGAETSRYYGADISFRRPVLVWSSSKPCVRQ